MDKRIKSPTPLCSKGEEAYTVQEDKSSRGAGRKMETTDKSVEIYQLRVWLRKISPQIWRRLLVRSDSTIAELHDTLQIAFGWMDEHVNQFLIRGKPYGMGRPGGLSSSSTKVSSRK
jgi:Plasmid pRiA4b ORF-3-like protein